MNQIKTPNQITWCPGCPNFLILEAAKRTIEKLIKDGEKQENFAMVTGIGCHAKIFDYLNISGIYGLHGRVLPTALGITLGNPNLNVIGFAGDGDTYAEGMEHFIHAFRHNSNMALIVHDNRAFSLTTGQATPTSPQGFKTKTEPLGEFSKPLNPLRLALAAQATFVARMNAFDLQDSMRIIEKAIKHKGFAFIEVMQQCLIFEPPEAKPESLMYKIPDNKDKSKAEKLAEEWDYNTNKGKIPIGIIYQEDTNSLQDKWPQLSKLKKERKAWKDLK